MVRELGVDDPITVPTFAFELFVAARTRTLQPACILLSFTVAENDVL
jgi:hypothetical protein